MIKCCFLISFILLTAITPPVAGAQGDNATDSVSGLTPISLDEAIAIARVNSVDAAVALNELRTSYWNYRTYRADLLPEVSFAATLPSYRKSYSPYQLDDGTFTFVRNNVLEMQGELAVTQSIWATGGTLTLYTSIDWLRQLDSGFATPNRFMSVPVALTLNQPIFGVNHTRWNRRIEPVRYREAMARFMSATEEVAMSAVNHFFNLLMSKVNLSIARQNHENAARLFEVAEAKYSMGQISRNDLLQLQLNLLSAESELTSRLTDYQSAMFGLRTFLSIEDESVTLDPVLPDATPLSSVNYADVLAKALERNSFARSVRRRQLEADYEVAKALADRRSISLFAQIGYTGTSSRIASAYDPLRDNQVVEVGFRIPILDWGKRAGKVRVARSNRDVVESRLRKERMDFEQDIFILVERFNNQRRQLDISLESDSIASRRYDTNVETFLVGRISTLDLNDSRVSKDERRRAVVDNMYLCWYYYYQLRSLTLWDYTADAPLEFDESIARK